MEYLISYFFAGLLLATSALMHGAFSRPRVAIAFVLSVLLWPLFVLIAPEWFLKSSAHSDGSALSEEDMLKVKLAGLSEATSSALSDEEARRLAHVAKYGDEYITIFGEASDFADILAKFWDMSIPPENYHAFERAKRHLDEDHDPEFRVFFSRLPPDWYFGFSTEFVKSIAKVDRKKQGRILEALGKIASAPTEVCGDTIKPLTGDLSGLWRCRLGDDRLIYFPDKESKKIVLISFGPRGEAYQDSVDVSVIASAINRPVR